jgi:hypothetical protein
MYSEPLVFADGKQFSALERAGLDSADCSSVSFDVGDRYGTCGSGGSLLVNDGLAVRLFSFDFGRRVAGYHHGSRS